ncbi:hypothetical protein F4782DRAFT_548114 [Xylaria castorea]|nr:hypothetical protein F4782DRAFT_548114 [Xylaria castorea]
MPPKPDNLMPPPRSNERVFYQGDEKEIIFRHSSVITSLPSSHSSSDAGVIRSSSRSISLADDQLSTEPIPTDFDHDNLFRSSPPYIQQVAPVTALNVPNQTDNGNSVGLSHQVENPKSKIDETSNNERQLRPRLARQNPPITRARGRQVTRCINGFDGSVERHSSADGEGSASPALGTECLKTSTDDDDDEYQLSESENDIVNSEQSTIDKIREISQTINDKIVKKPQKTTNKKAAKATYSSKPSSKQTAKAKTALFTAKKISRPVTNKATVPARKHPIAPTQVAQSPERLSVSLDEASPVRHNVRETTGTSKQKRKDDIPDSQDFVKDSQENAIPLKAKSRATNYRRPKKPFNQDSLGAQENNPDPTTSAWNITNTYQQSTVRQGKVLSPSLDKTEFQGNEEIQANKQSKPAALNTCQSATTRSRVNNGVGSKVDKGKGRAIDQNQPLPTSYEALSPQINQFSDQTSQYEDAEYVEMHLQGSPPSYQAEAEINEILGSFEPSELSVNEIKVTPTMRESFKHADVSTQANLSQFNPGPVRLDHVAEAKNEATQTGAFRAQPLLHDIYYRGAFKEEVAVGDDKTKHWLSRSPRVQDASGLSQVNPVAAGVRKEYEQAESPEKDLTMKIFRDLSNKTTPLHPTSRVWAQEIAKKSRQNNLKTSAPQINAGEAKTLGRTPETTLESHKNPISKRETALGGQRNAIFDSIQEITMVVLQHLKSKESSIDSIVGIYRQRGHRVLDMLLDRQSIELRQAASDFDGRCIRLEHLFEESARHARATDKRISNENNRHLRDCAQRSKELEETITLARDAVASI